MSAVLILLFSRVPLAEYRWQTVADMFLQWQAEMQHYIDIDSELAIIRFLSLLHVSWTLH